jgi:hypothetical protein
VIGELFAKGSGLHEPSCTLTATRALGRAVRLSPEYVLHRLSESEIDAERERGDELRQAKLARTRFFRHRSIVHPGVTSQLSRGQAGVAERAERGVVDLRVAAKSRTPTETC